MTEYIRDPITTDADALQQEAYDYIQSVWPDWVPSEGNFEAWLIAACARMVAEARDVASDVPAAIMRYLGERLHGIPPVAATSAAVNSTWAVTENAAGRTIEAGWIVGIEGSDGQLLGFEVVADVAIAAGVLVTGAGEVQLRATDAGEIANALGGNGTLVDLIDPSINWIDSITLTGATAGGSDEESEADYLNRLSARLTLLSPRPILPRDFELLAVDIARQNGVSALALALDGYNPNTMTNDNERTVSIALRDEETGADLAGAVLTTIDDELQAQREVNFEVYTISPDRTTVDVTFTAKCLEGYDPAEVEAAAEAAVNDYFEAANWGVSTVEDSKWIQATAVRRQEVSTVLNNVEGLDYWETLTIGLNGGAQNANETNNLAGAAPVTEPGVISGTVTAP